MKTFVFTLLFAAFSTTAHAHSKVDTTSPENGAIVEAVPAEISFNFANDIRLTRVEMTLADHPSVQLNLGDQTRFERIFTLPLENMGLGTYHIEWRGLGVDGHAMQGKFTFVVE